MNRLFVTAAGTDVGKTFVCCLIAAALGERHQCRIIKPIATGMDPSHTEASDAAALLRAEARDVTAEAVAGRTPWRYRAALSPDMAASREGRVVPFDEVVAFSLRDEGQSLTVIEGIGGALVPLDEQRTVLDWMAATATAVWLVGGTYLGALSHTIATQRAIEAAGLAVDVIVVSESTSPAAPLPEIVEVVRRFAGTAEVLGLSRPPDAIQRRRLIASVPTAPIDARPAGGDHHSG